MCHRRSNNHSHKLQEYTRRQTLCHNYAEPLCEEKSNKTNCYRKKILTPNSTVVYSSYNPIIRGDVASTADTVVQILLAYGPSCSSYIHSGVVIGGIGWTFLCGGRTIGEVYGWFIVAVNDYYCEIYCGTYYYADRQLL